MKRIVSWIVGPLGVVVVLGFMGPVGARTAARGVHSGHSGPKGSASGRGVYMQNCARCHGANARGKSGPRLVRTSMTLGEIEQTVTEGRPPKMPGFDKQLSSEQVKAVAAYVRSLRGRS
jgi:mono/diheme cytochrome c family protein